MAITRAQQYRQMLKEGSKPVVQGGVDNYLGKQKEVKAPLKWQSSPDHPTTELAYITEAEKDLLVKLDLHSSLKDGVNKGPSGIMSLNGFGSTDPDQNVGGGDIGAAETGNFGGFDGTPKGPALPPGVKAKPSKTAKDFRSGFIAAGAGRRVNPGFFDSINVISPDELRAAKAFAPDAFAKTRGGLSNFISSGGILGNIIKGVGQRLGFGKKFDQPTYDMSRFSGLPLGGSAAFQNLDIRDKFNRKGISPDDIRVDDEDEDEDNITTINDDDFSDIDNQVAGLTKMQKMGLKAKKSNVKRGLMTPQEALDSITPFNDPEDPATLEEVKAFYGIAADGGRIGAAEGGMPYEGGIMDLESARQMYGLGKLVKKVTRSVKKIAKSPIGKAAILAAGGYYLGGGSLFGAQRAGMSGFSFGNLPGASFFGKGSFNPLLRKVGEDFAQSSFGSMISGLPGGGVGAGILGASTIAGLLTKEQEEEAQLIADETGIDIAEIRANPNKYLGRRFRAEGGSMDEPVAKKTMPLLDMGGQEMDLRAEGGFVPIGRMEKADDVPARLSKNEFVFTADAVRNAGEGDVDKGAEVMYNMMKNLESGGEVSEESQGLEGARKMFQTSQRLEEVL